MTKQGDRFLMTKVDDVVPLFNKTCLFHTYVKNKFPDVIYTKLLANSLDYKLNSHSLVRGCTGVPAAPGRVVWVPSCSAGLGVGGSCFPYRVIWSSVRGLYSRFKGAHCLTELDWGLLLWRKGSARWCFLLHAPLAGFCRLVHPRHSNSSCLAAYLCQKISKLRKENIKPRKGSEVKFVQVNIQKSKAGQTHLNGIIGDLNKQGKQFFCLVQEPCSSRSKLIRQPNTVQRYAWSPDSRAAIYVHNSIDTWYLESFSNRDMVAVQATINSQRVIIASIYMDGKEKEPIKAEHYKLVEYAHKENMGLLLGLDSNCHSTLYGPKTNKRGEKFEDFIAGMGLHVENIGHTPTYESRGAQTCIDCTLSKNLNSSVLKWTVDCVYNGSDHNTIRFSIDADKFVIPATWKWHKADWTTFKASLQTLKYSLPNVIDQQYCEDMLQDLYSAIEKAMIKSIPKGKPKLIDKNNPWWTEEFHQKRKSLNKKYKRQRTFPTPSNIRQYNQEHQKYKRDCERARLRSWRDLQSNIESVSEMNVFRKIIEGSTKVSLGALKRPDGTITNPGEETLDELIATHFASAIPLKPTPRHGKLIRKTQITGWDEDMISEFRVKAALHSFINKKSPGTDEVPPLILKNLPDKVIQYITTLFKVCILLGYTPTKWKECKLVFIPKPGKASYQIAKAWRPISLTNYLLKALEKLAVWHMDEKIIEYPLHTRQHGFRSDRNTETSLSKVTAYIERHIYQESHVIGVFLDIQAAFDTIRPECIREELLKHGGNPNMVDRYYNYITHRNLHINIKGYSRTISSSQGFPQGGVCSAKFWIVAFDEAIEILNEHGVYGNGFADDCVALIGGTNLHQMMSRIQKVVTKIEQWGISKGLHFNAGKTEVIVFSHATKLDLPNKLRVSDQPIDFGTQAKYLGVILDNKLSWLPHTEKVVRKAKQYIFMLRQAISKRWGPKTMYMKWAYTAIIKARIIYGCLVWGHSLNKETRSVQINRINKLMVAILSNTRKSTPRDALEVTYGVPPLDIVIMKEALASMARNRAVITLDWQGRTKGKVSFVSHIRYWEDLATSFCIDLDFTDRAKGVIWDRNFTIDQKSFLKTAMPIQSQINIFTDGSKTSEHVGLGFVKYRNGIEIATNSTRLPDYCTVFQGEVLAIKLATIELTNILTPTDRFIKLFSDSRAALLSLDNIKYKSSLVKDTIDALNTLGSMVNRLDLAWIKAHNNYSGNERADELAKNSMYNSVGYFNVKPPLSFTKFQLKNMVNTIWQSRWAATKSCRMTKIFYPSYSMAKAKELCKLSRSDARRLIEIVTGQNNLHYVQNKIKRTQDLCRLCEEEEETFDHFVNDCPCLTQLQLQYFGLTRIINSDKWRIASLLKFSREPQIDSALKASYSE